jgi:hypothetical protein
VRAVRFLVFAVVTACLVAVYVVAVAVVIPTSLVIDWWRRP